MQTTKWGPDGWKFMHFLTFKYPDQPDQSHEKKYQSFFTHMGNMLPCIYCRNSYRGFIIDIPLSEWLMNRYAVTYWLYLIHNKVNDKLRKQGYLHEKNPAYKTICRRYKQYNNDNTLDIGWDFIYSIIFNYPEKPGPVDKYNYKIFLKKLKEIHPNDYIRESYTKHSDANPVDDYLVDRHTLIYWFYSIHSLIVADLIGDGLSIHPIDSFEEICRRYEGFRASCSTSTGNSCRIPAKKIKI